MKTNVHFDQKASRVRISMDPSEARILQYALRQFARDYALMDEKARGWAFQMNRLSDDLAKLF